MEQAVGIRLFVIKVWEILLDIKNATDLYYLLRIQPGIYNNNNNNTHYP